METEVTILDMVLAHRFLSTAGWVGDEYLASRPYSGLVYVVSGSADYIFSGKLRFHAAKGDLLYLPAGEGYIVKSSSAVPFEHLTVNFVLSQTNALQMLPTVQHLQAPRRVEQLFTKLITVWTHRREHYRVYCLGLLYTLIYTALEESIREHDVYKKKLAPAITYIEKHFRDTEPMTDLASLCHISSTYFRRLFHRTYKQSPTSYITRLRMSYASDLLLAGHYSIGQTAELSGYLDAAYFSRVFKQTFGIAPSLFKKQQLTVPK